MNLKEQMSARAEQKKKMEKYEADIAVGERVKVLFEIIMAELGMNYENSMTEVIKKMAEAVQDYYAATDALGELMKEVHKREAERDAEEIEMEKTDEDVSVSNY